MTKTHITGSIFAGLLFTATHQRALEIVKLDDLKRRAIDMN